MKVWGISIVLMAVICVIVAAAFWSRTSSPVSGTAEQGQTQSPVVDNAVDDDTTRRTVQSASDETESEAAEMQFAEATLKEIVYSRHVMPNEEPIPLSFLKEELTGSSEADPFEHKASIQESIASAMAGDAYDAARIIEYQRVCRQFPEQIDSVEPMLDTRQQFPIDSYRVNVGIISYPVPVKSFDEYLSIQRRRFSECKATRGIFGVDFSTQLKLRAQSGDVMARFLYAMMALPEYLTGPERIEAVLERTHLALEFTQKNLEEQEPLGLLGMGLSYRNFNSFTHNSQLLGDAFIIAAERCGAPRALLDRITLPLTSSWFESAWADSEVLVQAFCSGR